MSTDQTYTSSELAQRAERLINDSSFLSSDSEKHSPKRRSQSKKSSSTKQLFSQVKRPSHQLQSPQVSKTAFKPKEQTKSSKSLTRKISQTNVNSIENLDNYVPWLKQRLLMKNKISELETALNKKDKKLKNVLGKYQEEHEQLKVLGSEVETSHKKDKVINQLKERVLFLEKKELSLMQELQEQQDLAKDAISKLKELEEEAVEEIEKAKAHFKEYYTKVLEQELDQQALKYQKLKIEKEQLASALKQHETKSGLDKANKSIMESNELVSLNNMYNEKLREVDRLKTENKILQLQLNDKENSNPQTSRLKYRIEELESELKSFQSNEIRSSRKNLESKVHELERELETKEKLIKERDQAYRSQLEIINQKILNYQLDFQQFEELKHKNRDLNESLVSKDNELQSAKKYYKEKLNMKKQLQSEQKEEWSGIYNELLKEIRFLKDEIEHLGLENKRLASSINKPY